MKTGANYALGLGLAAWYVIAMRKMAVALFAFAVMASGCGESTTGDGGASGSGGSGGSGGTPPPPPPQAVDQTCRDWCANEPEGPSCHQGPFESVLPCYEDCLSDYQDEEAEFQCGDEWIAIKDCQIDLDCEDLFGDCDSIEDAHQECVQLATKEAFCETTCPWYDISQCVLDTEECKRQANNRTFCESNCPSFDIEQCQQDTTECEADRYCESNCPTENRETCIQRYISTGTCDSRNATEACRTYCTRQDLSDCVDEWTATAECQFDDGSAACAVLCPGYRPQSYCAEYWEDYGACPANAPACLPDATACGDGGIDPIEETCVLASPPAIDNCTGGESIENPTSCSGGESQITVVITQLEIPSNQGGDSMCNDGYNLDACDGVSCDKRDLAPGEGMNGVDNALAGLASVLLGAGGNLGGLNQAFHDSLCAGEISITLTIETNKAENCAIVSVNGSEAILMNLSDLGCLSGAFGEIPLNVGGNPGKMNNAVIRATLSERGLSTGVLGATIDQATAGAIMDQIIPGGSAIVARALDIKDDLSGDATATCDALSATFKIGGGVPSFPERRMFVTSTVHTAALGGIAGADALCATQAADASLVGDFKAWLSTNALSASDRLSHDNGPFVLVDGTIIANDWDDLVDGSLVAPINLDAMGQTRTGDVRTGTLANGDFSGNSDCGGFQITPVAWWAMTGNCGSTTSTWTQELPQSCIEELRLYCVEQ